MNFLIITNKMDTDNNIRNQIIILDNENRDILKEYTDIELAASFSKNKKNYEILEKLLLKENNKSDMLTEVLILIIKYKEKTSSVDAIKLLIKYGADVNREFNYRKLPFSEKRSILINCCLYPISSVELIELLIESGADVNSKIETRTPLMHFIRNCSKVEDLQIIKLLIRNHSQVNYKDIYGLTSLMVCFELRYNMLIRYDIIKILLDNKADIYIKNNNNENILNIVEKAIGKNSDIYSLIFNYVEYKNNHLCEFDINFIYNYL